MPEHSTWDRGALLGRDRSRRCQFSPETFARMQFGDFNHFMGSCGYVDTTHFNGFTVTVDGAGTIVMLDRVGGWLQLLAGAGDTNGINMQQAHEAYLPAANRSIHFGCRIEMDDAEQSVFFAGLAIIDTDIEASVPADIIAFQSHDGDLNLDFQCQATASARAAVDTGVDLVSGTAIELGFVVNGLTNVQAFVNGVLLDTFAVTLAAQIPITELAPVFEFKTGENIANSLKIDWYSLVQNYL